MHSSRYCDPRIGEVSYVFPRVRRKVPELVQMQRGRNRRELIAANNPSRRDLMRMGL
jgi:hypothetical protein